MIIKLSNANFSTCGLGQIPAITITDECKEICSKYSGLTTTDIIQFQVFMNSLGHGEDNSIWDRIYCMVLPFMASNLTEAIDFTINKDNNSVWIDSDYLAFSLEYKGIRKTTFDTTNKPTVRTHASSYNINTIDIQTVYVIGNPILNNNQSVGVPQIAGGLAGQAFSAYNTIISDETGEQFPIIDLYESDVTKRVFGCWLTDYTISDDSATMNMNAFGDNLVKCYTGYSPVTLRDSYVSDIDTILTIGWQNINIAYFVQGYILTIGLTSDEMITLGSAMKTLATYFGVYDIKIPDITEEL